MVKSILVIDDERAVRDAFELALMDDGYEVRLAEDGKSGLAAIGEKCPDLVFLDLKMPGMDGVETMRQIKEMEPDAPIYIVTAFQKEFMEPLNKATEDGLEFQIASKPLSGEQIRQIAKAFLGE